MNFGEFLYLQPDNIKKQVRNIEKKQANACWKKSRKKQANAQVAIVFNKWYKTNRN